MTYYSTRRAIESAEPIPLETLAARFPTIAATHGAPTVSARYAHISTLDVLRRLASEGWEVYSAQQSLTRLPERAPFARHVVRMRSRNPGVLREIGDSVAELQLDNGHDGSAAYKLSGALQRLICKNGLTVGTAFASFRVSHVGRDLESRVIDASYTVVNQFSAIADRVAEMESTRLGAAEQTDFARRALALRYGPDDSTFTTESILGARRAEDTAANLWTVFNRVQENIIRGGARGVRVNPETGKARATSIRAVSSIDAGLRLNRGLWDIAESYLPERVAA